MNTEMKQQVESFDRLYAAYVDDRLKPEEFEAFQQLLKQSPEARKRYLDLSVMRSAMLEKSVMLNEVLEPAGAEPVLELAAAGHDEVPTTKTGKGCAQREAQKHRFMIRRWLPAAAAALLLSAVTFYGIKLQDRDGRPQIMFAQYLAGPQSDMWESGERIALGKSQHLVQGNVRIELANKVSVAVKGPARFTIHDEMHMSLDEGQVTAYVPDQGKGFEITTPNFDVVDKGTSFGVTVAKDGNVSLSVFDGEVAVKQTLKSESTESFLLAGQSAQSELDQPLTATSYERRPYLDLLNCQFGLVSGQAVMLFGEKSLEAAEPDDHRVLILPEKQHVRLTAPLKLDVTEPSVIDDPSDFSPIKIKKGRVVSSYLVKYKPVSQGKTLETTLTFDRPIQGIIMRGESLVASDNQLSKVYIHTGLYRGMDTPNRDDDKGAKDELAFSEDMKSIKILIRNARWDDSFRLILAEDMH